MLHGSKSRTDDAARLSSTIPRAERVDAQPSAVAEGGRIDGLMDTIMSMLLLGRRPCCAHPLVGKTGSPRRSSRKNQCITLVSVYPPIKLAFMAATTVSRSPALPTSFADADAVARTHLWYPCSISDRSTLMLPGTRYTGAVDGPNAYYLSDTTCPGKGVV